MKCVDSNFKVISNNDDKFYIDELLGHIEEAIISSECDKQIVDDVLRESDNIVIQITDGKQYSIVTPGDNVRTMKFPSAGAFKTNMIVNLTDDSLNITPGLCLRPGFLPEQLIHELIHAVSSKQNMSFDENGITYTKTGTKINYYDKELNDLNQYDNISSDLLNEGMTDYLTFVVTGDSNKVHYYFGTVLADILNKNSNSLINAYFSKDLTDLVDFIHEFDASQDVISYKEIVEVDQSNMLGDLSQRIMQGAVNYCLANSKENELEQNVEYIKQRLSYLDDYYCLDNGSWSDNINFKSRNK